ncbi:MAG TPA: peptidoglycan-binding protein [Spirochaetota bacterium]|jgi:peptidoglycan hydrolase-like protein with peptidoglycan-binding domain|nr:MAG: Autolytic lysozyme [Spirochaetes bacterium ADurb.Bin133]HNZ27283.1 peptidoglycan-binding protein [Spirochaetota bacterium]HPY87529.1 peptidoglycan-binding protein [Spirochaetota bacterium]HQB60554.1 peptidoglycan-binding protein [Spirochaetota bacterium]
MIKKGNFIIYFVLVFLLITSCSNSSFLTSDVSSNSPVIEDVVAVENAVSDAVSWPLVAYGQSSLSVKAVQYFLKQKGYSISIDGDFGSGTLTAVKNFQKANGLTADGKVGSATWSKLIITVKRGNSGYAVRAVQDLLKNKFGYSLSTDGDFGSGTQNAVKSFQTKKKLSSDGIVGATTWLYIIGSSGTTSGSTTDFWGSRISSWTFPVKGGYLDPKTGARYFGAPRNGGTRAHAGIDIVPNSGPGTLVYAMTNGTVTGYYHFYAGTYALEVENDDGTVARYTEITSTKQINARIKKGEAIGKIIRNNSGGSYMLHLEVYMGDSTGALTNSANTSYKYVSWKKYNRRSDLVDPMGVTRLPLP